MGSNPPLRRPFFTHHSFGSIVRRKRDNAMFQLTLRCCMCCNPANGKVDFEEGQLIKI